MKLNGVVKRTHTHTQGAQGPDAGGDEGCGWCWELRLLWWPQPAPESRCSLTISDQSWKAAHEECKDGFPSSVYIHTPDSSWKQLQIQNASTLQAAPNSALLGLFYSWICVSYTEGPTCRKATFADSFLLHRPCSKQCSFPLLAPISSPIVRKGWPRWSLNLAQLWSLMHFLIFFSSLVTFHHSPDFTECLERAGLWHAGTEDTHNW